MGLKTIYIILTAYLVYLSSIDTDPTTPHTVFGFISNTFPLPLFLFLMNYWILQVWSLGIGGFVYWMSWYAVDQTIVQRFLAMPTLRSAQM